MAAQLTILVVANQVIRHLSKIQLEEAQTILQLEGAQPILQQVEPLTTHKQEVTRTILHLQVKIQPAHVMTYMIPLLS